MKLNNRIKLLIIPLSLVPFIIMLVGAILIGKIYQSSLFGSDYQRGIESFANPYSAMNDLVDRIQEEVTEGEYENVDRYIDIEYLDSLNRELAECHAFLVVRVSGEILYRGQEGSKFLDPFLPEYGNNIAETGGVYIDTMRGFFLRQQDFELSDGRKGSVYIITYTDRLTVNTKHYIIRLVILLAIVLLLISCFISLYIYRTIVKPLKALQEGTERIKEGNLDEDVVVQSGDEIGQVCQSFNEMRLKLKESVDGRMVQERENSELISNISHDLRTPITAIKGYVEGIMDGVADTPEKMDRYLRTIYTKANEMDALIDELAVYSRIDTNTMPYNFVKIFAKLYFDDCAEEFQIDLESVGVAWRYSNTCDRDIRMVVDPEQLRRVLHNTVSNALKYNHKDERYIHLQVRELDEQYIEVTVEDNGDGIEAKDIPYIFKRMYRTDSSRNSNSGGSGLGLSIAKKIVEEHGGSIRAESQPEVGTKIIFTLKKWRNA